MEQVQREVPVEERDPRSHVPLQQGVDQPVVEIQSGFIDGMPIRQDARPAYGQAVGVGPQVGDQADIFVVSVVVVTSAVSAVVVEHGTWLVAEGIPNAGSAAVRIRGALDLV